MPETVTYAGVEVPVQHYALDSRVRRHYVRMMQLEPSVYTPEVVRRAISDWQRRETRRRLKNSMFGQMYGRPGVIRRA